MLPHPSRPASRAALHAALRQRIIDLDLAPGAVLRESELTADHGVSRTPIRECLIMLRQEGFVEVLPQVGTFVARVDPRRVADAQFIREAVETTSLQQVDYPLDAQVAERLKANVASQQGTEDDVAAFVALDEEFHRGLLALSGRESAWDAIASERAHLDRARRLGLAEVTPVMYIAEHAEILDAVLSGDREHALDALRRHVRAVFSDIDRVRERMPELFTPEA
ncbi:GntR family transcriptional regulator [Microbacterium sp. H1-D42]|uniref:GntR family transcriptional regulator n=1 Tax=Microbacterium sp. H1-D42 TaxID=2925844 RepID=UPI001F538804|nr:GntR family transcriptional regulator [Microbacterium sp. H1-D42]UNK70340.1 GntR family transcriptional regulator [Microbacterium sp. H1-D42]